MFMEYPASLLSRLVDATAHQEVDQEVCLEADLSPLGTEEVHAVPHLPPPPTPSKSAGCVGDA